MSAGYGARQHLLAQDVAVTSMTGQLLDHVRVDPAHRQRPAPVVHARGRRGRTCARSVRLGARAWRKSSTSARRVSAVEPPSHSARGRSSARAGPEQHRYDVPSRRTCSLDALRAARGATASPDACVRHARHRRQPRDRRSAPRCWPHRRGYAVCLVPTPRTCEAAHAVAVAVRARGGEALVVRADVSSDDDVRGPLRDHRRDLAGQVTAVVNNAGILFPQGRVDGVDAGRLRRLLDVNVVGAFLVAREAVLRMSTARGAPAGSIVNVGSRAGRARLGARVRRVRRQQGGDRVAHDRPVARGGRRGHPGQRRPSGHHPHRRSTAAAASPGGPTGWPRRSRWGGPGRPSEVAEAICWLASDEAGFVTGTFVDVSGGR